MLTRDFDTTGSRRHSDTLTQHPFDDSSDLEDDHRPERASKDESGAEEAYLYGAGDDDAEDEYATFYDGDDQGAKMRRYWVTGNLTYGVVDDNGVWRSWIRLGFGTASVHWDQARFFFLTKRIVNCLQVPAGHFVKKVEFL